MNPKTPVKKLDEEQPKNRLKRFEEWLDKWSKPIITFVAVIVILIHLIFPTLTIDTITGILILIALLPWVSTIFKSIELTGLGKIEFQELKAKVNEAVGVAQNAQNQAQFAVAQTSTPAPTNLTTVDADQQYVKLAQDYNHIRSTQKSGDLRTYNMTKVVSDMATLVPQLKNFKLDTALVSTDGGIRLSGYAYLYVLPDPSKLSALVNALTKIEDTPFGQYWALQALSKVLAETQVIDPDIRRNLQNFLDMMIKPDTDRYYLLSRILKAYPERG